MSSRVCFQLCVSGERPKRHTTRVGPDPGCRQDVRVSGKQASNEEEVEEEELAGAPGYRDGGSVVFLLHECMRGWVFCL